MLPAGWRVLYKIQKSRYDLDMRSFLSFGKSLRIADRDINYSLHLGSQNLLSNYLISYQITIKI
jgi:hypothetical protein